VCVMCGLLANFLRHMCQVISDLFQHRPGILATCGLYNSFEPEHPHIRELVGVWGSHGRGSQSYSGFINRRRMG